MATVIQHNHNTILNPHAILVQSRHPSAIGERSLPEIIEQAASWAGLVLPLHWDSTIASGSGIQGDTIPDSTFITFPPIPNNADISTMIIVIMIIHIIKGMMVAMVEK